MTLETRYFRREFYYDVHQVEKYVNIIQTTTSPKRARAYKNLVFRMMKNIVKKNISNCLNLLRRIDFIELPTRDDLITDCLDVFEKCCEKYLVGRGYNFYFFFNKSLSRKFFRNYQKEMKRCSSNMNYEDITIVIDKRLKVNESYSNVELLLEQLHFSDIEKRICYSKIMGQRPLDFLSKNPDVTDIQYSNALKSVKSKLLTAKSNKDI